MAQHRHEWGPPEKDAKERRSGTYRIYTFHCACGAKKVSIYRQYWGLISGSSSDEDYWLFGGKKEHELVDTISETIEEPMQ